MIAAEVDTAAHGNDGRLYFYDSAHASDMKQVLTTVRCSGVTVAQVRDFRGTVEREDAAIGTFICIEPLTKPVLKEAADAPAAVKNATRHLSWLRRRMGSGPS